MVAPITLSEAKEFVSRHHRHNKRTVGGLFAVSARDDGKVHGVAIASRPVARMLQDGATVEITRTCTDGTRNANSMLYGAICRAAKALGYRRAITYTLQEESGASLRAAGFREDARLKARPTWACRTRHRVQVDLFGEESRPAGPKVRWVRELAAPAPGDGDGGKGEK
jgi:hypothetical protein